MKANDDRALLQVVKPAPTRAIMVTPEPTKPRGGKKRSASEAFGLRQSLVDLAAGRKQDAAQISVGPQDQTRTKEHK